MANYFLLTLIPLLSSISLLLASANSQTTSFTYDFNGSHPTDLSYQGDAHFPSDFPFLRLTKTNALGYPAQRSVGRVMYSKPIQFWKGGAHPAQVDFETTVKFVITPVDSNPGDGLVFFIAPVGSTIPPGHSGGNFGVFATSSGRNPSVFAVEFDTFSNADVDPKYRHIGINIEHLRSSNVTDVGDAILAQEVTAHINYQEANKMIFVKVSAGSKSFEVSYVFDLSTVLNQQIQVGLAASTGGAVSVHDIISWHFTSTLAQTITQTSFTYDFCGSSSEPTNLTYQGDAHFPDDSTFLRLIKTNASGYPQFSSTGRVVYSNPVQFRSEAAQADFETTLKFIITPVDVINPGDGLTFFIVPVGYGIPYGSNGGYLGIFNPSGSGSGSTTSVFAVEFDTWSNPWDPDYRHVGIDIESPTSVNLTRVDDAIVGTVVTARISYVEATKLINVNVGVGSQEFEVSYVYDLSSVLPEQVQVGISASNGGVVCTYYIISWNFTSNLVTNGAAGENEGVYINNI